MKKRLLLLLMCLVTVFGLAACGNNNEGKEPASSEEANSTEVTESKETGNAEYAVILKTQASDFWVKMKEGVEAEAKELGIKVDVFAAQSEENTEEQLNILQNAVNKGYKAIGIAPLSPVNAVSAVADAYKKGIYVMNIDEKLDMDQLKQQGGAVIGFATTDNVAVGKKAADFIVEKLQKGDKVAIVEGKAGNVSGEDRKNGAQKAFEDAGMTVVGSLPADWDRQKALDVANSFIQQNADLKAIYCCNDGMALGALQAVMNANKVGEILVVGTDGDAEAVASIEKGELSATVAQDPAGIGRTALREMVEAVKNKITVDPNAEPKVLPVESKLITK
ncbi:D-allose transporter substrate-binding protein [uncultured Murdochiella sp.]|uniref:D-allose transporter substrate-binding protein n=1 Tax=uncultured Murdochiella sp. TaxID=1586095 RepID=UPI0028061CFC|nr:D-allose transporter substrate-binding protein [uncultured Murdochiella sp.]